MAIPISGDEFVKLVLRDQRGGVEKLVELVGEERDCVEFKAAINVDQTRLKDDENYHDCPWRVVQAVIALANTRGGVVIIGIDDETKKPIGLANIDTTHQRGAFDEDTIFRKIINPVIARGEFNTRKKGEWRYRANLLEGYLERMPLQGYRDEKVVLLLVHPVPEGQPLLRVEEKNRSGRNNDVLWARKQGVGGECIPYSLVEEMEAYQRTRKVDSDSYSDWLKKFYQEAYSLDEQDAEERLVQQVGSLRSVAPDKTEPDPDANLTPEDAARSRSLGAYLLEPAPLAFDALPFDLGTVWGLERGRFLGIVDSPLEQVHANLVMAERLLLDELRVAGFLGRFPERWWLRLDVKKCLHGPADIEELLAAALDSQDELITALVPKKWQRRNNGRTIMPGILLRARDQGDLSTMVNWARQVAAIFPEQSAALVLCVESSLEFSGAELAKSLVHKLTIDNNVLSYWPLYRAEAVPTSPPAFATPAAAAPGRTLQALKGLAKRRPGSALGQLIEYTIKTNDRLDLGTVLQREYQTILGIVDQLSVDDSSGNPEDQQVVGDLEELVQWAPEFKEQALLTREVLRFTEAYRQETTGSNLRNFLQHLARSPAPQVRQGALAFAVKNDLYLNWWVEGAGWEPDHYPNIDELILLEPICLYSEGGDAVLQLLVLALLRAFHYQGDQRWLHLLERYDPYCLSAFRELIELVRGLRSVNVRECLDGFLLLVMRSSSPLDFNGFDQVSSSLYQSPHLWWALGAGPPQREWLGKVLLFGEEYRAALGLIGEADKQIWDVDQTKKHNIMVLRRGLPLAFYPSGSQAVPQE